MATVVGWLIVGWLGVTAWQTVWPLWVARWPSLARWQRQGLWAGPVLLAVVLLGLFWGALPEARLSQDWSRLELERVQLWATLVLLPWLAGWTWYGDPARRPWRAMVASTTVAPAAPMRSAVAGKGKKKRRR